jgi:hypothetical protein
MSYKIKIIRKLCNDLNTMFEISIQTHIYKEHYGWNYMKDVNMELT